MAIIKTENLTFRYENTDRDVIRDMNIEIEQGSFVAVLGHNGCGKSTFASHLNAILLPTGGKVYVDGEKLDEYYLDENIYTEPKLYGVNTVVPEGCVFVMGDNRPVSKDSRYIGPISVESIVGKVFFRFWPINKMGTVEE